jgi:hypothetical protein
MSNEDGAAGPFDDPGRAGLGFRFRTAVDDHLDALLPGGALDLRDVVADALTAALSDIETALGREVEAAEGETLLRAVYGRAGLWGYFDGLRTDTDCHSELEAVLGPFEYVGGVSPPVAAGPAHGSWGLHVYSFTRNGEVWFFTSIPDFGTYFEAWFAYDVGDADAEAAAKAALAEEYGIGSERQCSQCGVVHPDAEEAEACCRAADPGRVAHTAGIEEPIGPVWRERATRELWKIEPIEQPRRIPLPRRVYTEAEWRRIQYGFVPEVMEEKWFAFVEGDRLYLHRSWTGLGVFEARFERDQDGWRITEAITPAKSPAGYEHPEDESLYLESLIASRLLGEAEAWEKFQDALVSRTATMIAAEDWLRLLNWLHVHSSGGLYPDREKAIIERFARKAASGAQFSVDDAKLGFEILERARNRGFPVEFDARTKGISP